MLFNIFRNSGYDLRMKITLTIFSLVIVLFSLTIHELSHGLMAYALGDPTAKSRGRLTLNPLKHLNPIGTIAMLLFGIGWAEPVPINPSYFKHRKTGMAVTALAGPLSNVILSFIALIFSTLCMNGLMNTAFESQSAVYSSPLYLLYLFFTMMHTMNLYLAIFNLIPVPPLDGSRILFIFLPSEYYFKVMKYERYLALILVALFYMNILDRPLAAAVNAISSGMQNLINLVI